MAFNIITKNNYQDLSSYLGEQIIDKMKSNTKSLICLASGDTPLGAFKYIVDKFENKDLTNDNFVFVGLDEWVGMDKNDKGSCQEYMDEYLFNKLKISKNQIVQFDAKSDDLKNECYKMDEYIFNNNGLDLVVLGIGMNGHLGLNEPNEDCSQYSHVVDLSESTKEVAQKYFDNETKLEKGITIGIRHFLEAKEVILVASGTRKAEIIKKICDSDITESIPATVLKKHNNVTLLLDKDSAKLLDEESAIGL